MAHFATSTMIVVAADTLSNADRSTALRRLIEVHEPYCFKHKLNLR